MTDKTNKNPENLGDTPQCTCGRSDCNYQDLMSPYSDKKSEDGKDAQKDDLELALVCSSMNDLTAPEGTRVTVKGTDVTYVAVNGVWCLDDGNFLSAPDSNWAPAESAELPPGGYIFRKYLDAYGEVQGYWPVVDLVEYSGAASENWLEVYCVKGVPLRVDLSLRQTEAQTMRRRLQEALMAWRAREMRELKSVYDEMAERIVRATALRTGESERDALLQEICDLEVNATGKRTVAGPTAKELGLLED